MENPKDKAIELIDKMLSKNPNKQDGISMIDTIQAKLCAIVAVDEILNIYQIKNAAFEFYELRNYWQDVKQELEQL
jgi:hypothetical protein